MGIRNLTAARWNGRALRSANAVKALNEMAYVSMDEDEPPIYWGGWERLAIAIGYDVPAEPDAGDQRPDAVRARARRKTAMNAAGAATKVLAEVGLIRLARAEAPGRNSEWSLCLGLANGPVKSGIERSRKIRDDGPVKSGIERSRKIRDDGPVKSGMTVPEFTGPQEEQDLIRRTEPDGHASFSTQVQTARERVTHDAAIIEQAKVLRAEQIRSGCADWAGTHFFEAKSAGWKTCKCGATRDEQIHFDAHYDLDGEVAS